MKRFLLVLAATALLYTPVGADQPVIRLVEYDGAIFPGQVDRILKAIGEAERDGDDLILIELDTPGGRVDIMEDVITRMLGAKVPIVVWVGPSGAHAASAGFFILIAADVAAMAPATRTGAASVVLDGPSDPETDVRLKKANSDAAALVRTIADNRGRNVEACERAVTSSESFTERVALEEGLIDLIARDRDELLQALNGREVELFDGTAVTLNTEDPRFVVTEFNFKERMLELMGTPEVAYLLLMLGLVCLFVELQNPGLIFPGVLGAICLLLFVLSSRLLPISVTGVLLILLSIVLFILEIKVTSFGLLTVGGVVCLVVGSITLIDSPIPAVRLSLDLVIPVSVAVAGVCIVAMRLAIRAQRAQVATGVEGLIGERGRATVRLAPEGKVQLHGELWNARTKGTEIGAGEPVRVVGVEGLIAIVERDAEAGR